MSRKRSVRSSGILNLLPRSTFAKSVAVLAGGTALGQAVTILIAPVLTRVYAPGDFGLLSVYTSLLGLLTGVGSLRYDVAIPVADDEDDSSNLLVLSLFFLVVTSLLLQMAVLSWGDRLSNRLGVPELAPYLWLLPLGVFGASVYQSLSFVAARQQEFNLVARTKLGQGIVQATMQLASGLLGLTGGGLLVGDVCGRISGSGSLAKYVWRDQKNLWKRVSLQSLKKTAVRFRRFPLFSSGSYLLNSAGTQLPMLLVASFYGTEVSGLFALGQRLISIPMVLVGQAVAQVYFAELSRLRRENPVEISRLFRSTTNRLLCLGGVPITLIGVSAPWLFALVFGSNWKEAGVYTQALTVMYVAQFVVVPISQSLNVLERQDLQLLWDIGRVVALVGGLAVIHMLGASPRVAIGLYGATVAVVYIVLYAMVALSIRRVHNDLTKTSTKGVTAPL